MKHLLNVHDLAKTAAISAVNLPRPKENSEYAAIRQLFDMAQECLYRTTVAEAEANRAKLAALGLSKKLEVDLEILAEKLGYAKKPFGAMVSSHLYTTPPMAIDEHAEHMGHRLMGKWHFTKQNFNVHIFEHTDQMEPEDIRVIALVATREEAELIVKAKEFYETKNQIERKA